MNEFSDFNINDSISFSFVYTEAAPIITIDKSMKLEGAFDL